MVLLNSRATSDASGTDSRDSGVLLSDGSDACASVRAEKGALDSGNGSESSRIVRELSLLLPLFWYAVY